MRGHQRDTFGEAYDYGQVDVIAVLCRPGWDDGEQGTRDEVAIDDDGIRCCYRLWCLGHNLAIAGALERAHYEGS
jgi:hypothetical protein